MSETDRPTRAPLLETLFGQENELKRDRVGVFADFVARIDSDPPVPTIVPVRRNGVTHIYALPGSPEDAPQLVEDMNSCFGQTFLKPRFTHLDQTDPIEGAIHRRTDGTAWRHRVPDRLHREQFACAVRRLNQIHAIAPERPRRLPGIAETYQRFRAALTVGDRDGAHRALDDMRSRRLFDPSNVLYLELELIATLESNESLLTWRGLQEVLSAPRPGAASSAIAGAVYRAHLGQYEAADDAAGLLGMLGASQVAPFMSALDAPHRCADLDARLAFIAAAVLCERREVALGLVDGLGARADFAMEMIARLGIGQQASDDPRALIDRGLYLEATQTLLGIPNSPERAAMLTVCAFHTSENADAVSMAERAYAALDGEQRASLRADPALADYIDAVHGPEGSECSIGSWSEAFGAVRSSTNPHATLRIALSRANTWSLEDALRTFGESERLVEAIEATDSAESAEPVRVLKTRLVSSVLEFRETPDGLAPVARALLEDLASTTSGSVGDLVQIAGLIDHALAQSASVEASERYRQILDTCRSVVGSATAERSADYTIEIVETIADRPVLDRSACEALFTELAMGLHQCLRDTGDMRWAVVRLLAEKAGLTSWADTQLPQSPDAGDVGATTPALAMWNGKKIGIYTLMEQAGRRAAELILRDAPNADVRTFSEHVAEERMVDWARRADVFVVCIQAAKHAAVNAIQAARGERATLEPRGKGCSSIIAELVRASA